MRIAGMSWSVAVALFGATMAGCSDGDDDGELPPAFEPVGAWLIDVQWLGGGCGLTGQSQIAIEVARAGDAYTVYAVTPPGTVDGPVEVTCTGSGCAIDAAILENGAAARWRFNVYTDLDGVISGDGQMHRYAQDISEVSCMQQWQATGTIQ